jgi:hypothetical protein
MGEMGENPIAEAVDQYIDQLFGSTDDVLRAVEQSIIDAAMPQIRFFRLMAVSSTSSPAWSSSFLPSSDLPGIFPACLKGRNCNSLNGDRRVWLIRRAPP